MTSITSVSVKILSLQNEFLELLVDIVVHLLENCHTQSCDQKANIYSACVSRLKYAKYRKIYAGQIFHSVLFFLLLKEYLEEFVLKEKLVTECDEVNETLVKSLQYVQTPMRKSEIDFSYFSLTRTGNIIETDYREILVITGTIVICQLFCKTNISYLINKTCDDFVQLLCGVHDAMRDCGKFKSLILYC